MGEVGGLVAQRERVEGRVMLRPRLWLAVELQLDELEPLAVWRRLYGSNGRARTLDAPPDVAELSVELAARMVSLAKDVPLAAALEECRGRLADGSAAARFAAMVERQGGDLAAFRARPPARHVREVSAACGGYVAAIDSAAVARAAFVLGAGRAKSTDALDMEAGVVLAVRRGDKVEPGALLACLHANDRPEALETAAAEISSAIAWSDSPVAVSSRILSAVE